MIGTTNKTQSRKDIIDAIKNSSSVLVCGHVRPDGDCVGAALAVRHLCVLLGKKADAVCEAEKPPEMFSFLPEYEYFCAPKHGDYDLFIAVDCAGEKRLGVYRQYLDSAKNSINIDHHPTNDGYCKINHIDPAASSTCSILYDLLAETGYIDVVMAEMLYTGLSTDTGHFMHANTDVKVFETAARLCKYGIDIGKINHAIYCNKSQERIKLTARALNGIRMYANGKIALMTITLDDLYSSGCGTQDTEGLIDYASSIAGVLISIAICEQPEGMFRVSFRSVSADVAAVAETFGGGGHKLAAGCIVYGDRYDVAERVTSAAAAALSRNR